MLAKPNAQPNQSLRDGIATLQALATSTEPVGTRELARRLGFEVTRIFGEPSPEPWHGFDGRQRIVNFVDKAFAR